ncbi:MAG: argininosuccinate lyase [Spirochaetia bacterium]
MAKLWQKQYDIDSRIDAFTTGNDYELDMHLLPWDCLASAAHAEMLAKAGIIPEQEADALKKGLSSIAGRFYSGSFRIEPEQEDCHTAIENDLMEQLGDTGKRIHTGRSRNDQVLAALRLFGKASLIRCFEEGILLGGELLDFARDHADVPMPGYTHTRSAMPSSVGLWAGAFLENLLDDLELTEAAYRLNDRSPLGSAASYGVPLPLDREMVSRRLGFREVQNNVLGVQNSRGKVEGMILGALDFIGITLARLSEDLIMFSMPEFGYFHLPPELCSGSSIMPQKMNPDVLELVRGKSHTISAWAVQVKSVIRNLPSGYNRDFQETKEPFIRGLSLIQDCLLAVRLTVEKLQVNRETLKSSFTSDVFAADEAFKLVAKGIPFRDAYLQVAGKLDKLQGFTPEETISNRTASGTAGNLRLEHAETLLESEKKKWAGHRSTLEQISRDLLGLSIRF